MSETMSDDHATRIYGLAFGPGHRPPHHCIEHVKQMVAAPDQNAATSIAEKAGWTDPSGVAFFLRAAAKALT